MEDHVTRVLKMLEEGKIGAEDAEKLISAIRKEQTVPPPPPPPPPPGASWSAQQTPPRQDRTDEEAKPDAGSAKSFEFSWSKKSGLPFDLSGLGKSISDALKKLDPDKIVK